MENNDIIKALECCITNDCAKCKAYDETNGEIVDCLHAICRNALDLINRQTATIERQVEAIKIAHKLVEEQNAEIERLEFRCDDCDRIGLTRSEYISCIKQAKSEAITAYHEEVKKRCIEGGIFPAFVNRQMEDVRKEMVGE